MIPTVSQVFEAARGHLGDTAVGGGQIFKDSMLGRYWPDSYSNLIRWLDRNGNKLIRRTRYFNLPANTGYASPASLGIPSMGEPENLWDRGVSATFTATVASITAATSGVPAYVDLTMTAHGLTAGTQVVAFGFDAAVISDAINGMWYISVPNANTIRLNGCDAVDLGSATGSTGVISTATEEFPSRPLTQAFDWSSTPTSSQNSRLTYWKWEGDAFRFVPCSSIRQVKIIHTLSGNAPLNPGDSVGIDDSQGPLSLFLAASASQAKGFRGKAADLFMRAVGNPTGDTTQIRGGSFYELAQLGVKSINKSAIVIGRYRPKRNVGPIPYGGC